MLSQILAPPHLQKDTTLAHSYSSIIPTYEWNYLKKIIFICLL